eukprot:gene4-22204_t
MRYLLNEPDKDKIQFLTPKRAQDVIDFFKGVKAWQEENPISKALVERTKSKED